MIERQVFSDMKIKTQNELQSLDSELNLFDEKDWDFFGGVVDTKEENFEFFNDIRDVDFVNPKMTWLKNIAPILSVALIIVVGGIWLGMRVLNKSDDSYDSVKNPQSSVSYHEGVAISSEELININQVLSNYFNTLQSKQDYSVLSDICLSTSTFESIYSSTISRMESAYDKYDCNARAIQEFGSYMKLNKITNAIVDDDTYYVYCNITVPSKEDVNEYIHLYSYNLTKFFNTNEVNEHNVARFLLDTMTVNQMPCTTNEYCIKLTRVSDSEYKIIDDSDLSSICSSAYNYSIGQITRILGGNISSMEKGI